MTIPRLTREGWQVWGRPLGFLALLLFGPLLLLATPLSAVAVGWMILLLLAVWTFLMGALIGAMTGASMPALSIVEGLLRRWVARFFPHPECLWLQWARQAHHPRLSHRYLDRAVALGGREAQFQEALVFLEGGLGAGGQSAGVERLRRAALRGCATHTGLIHRP